MIQILAFLFLTGLLAWKIFFPVSKPILGVYSRPGKRGVFKQWFMYLLLKWRKRSAAKGKKDVGYGLKLTEDIDKLECVKVRIKTLKLSISREGLIFSSDLEGRSPSYIKMTQMEE